MSIALQGHSSKYVKQYTLAFEVDGEWHDYTEDGVVKVRQYYSLVY